MIKDVINKENFRIETERLFLVPVTEEYANYYFEFFTPEITKYMYPEPFENIEVAQCFIEEFKRWQKEGIDLACNILDKKNEFIGGIEIYGLDSKTPEVGVWIRQDMQHNGYGREALSGFMEFFRKHMIIDYFIYEADRRNIGSINLVKVLGGVEKEYNEEESNGGNILELNLYQIK